MTNRGMLIVFSGPSGVGKDTILARFLASHPDCALSVSATTRAPRAGEVHGREYFFLSREEFDGLAQSGRMLEHAEYNGHCYGTPGTAVEEQLAKGKNVFLKIEVQGALQIREKFPESVLIFVAPPNWEVLRHRLSSRGTESQQSLAARLETAKKELNHACDYDYILINHAVEKTCVKLDAVVTAAASSSKRMKNYLQEMFTYA